MSSVRGNTVGMFGEENASEADVDIMNSATVRPDVSTVGATMLTMSSVKPRSVSTDHNETRTYSTSVNITGLEHFTEYTVKVCCLQ